MVTTMFLGCPWNSIRNKKENFTTRRNKPTEVKNACAILGNNQLILISVQEKQILQPEANSGKKRQVYFTSRTLVFTNSHQFKFTKSLQVPVTSLQPPTNHLPTTCRPPTNHLLITYWPPTGHLPTTYQPPTDHRPLFDGAACSILPCTYNGDLWNSMEVKISHATSLRNCERVHL